MKRFLLLLTLLCQLAYSEFSGIVTLGLAYKQDLNSSIQDSVAFSLLMIIRNGNFAFEGNRASYNLGTVWGLTIAPVVKIEQEDKIIESGLQLTTKLPWESFLQLNTFFDVSATHQSYQAELMIFRRFSINNLSLLPSFALQYDDKQRFNYLYGVNESALNIEFELLSIYQFAPSWNIASTFFINYYDEKVLQIPDLNRQLTMKLSLGVGYTF